MKNIILYFPRAESFFEVGQKILDEDKKETNVSVEKIECINSIVKVSLSDGNKYKYVNVPYSTQI